MDALKEFLEAPSVGLLKKLKMEEFWQVAGHYCVELGEVQGRAKKKDLLTAIQTHLIDQGVLEEDTPSLPDEGAVE